MVETNGILLEFEVHIYEEFANGFAYNAGIGIANFISPNAILENQEDGKRAE
jgi:hypothetical protein